MKRKRQFCRTLLLRGKQKSKTKIKELYKRVKLKFDVNTTTFHNEMKIRSQMFDFMNTCSNLSSRKVYSKWIEDYL